ncbi:hypothetical protein GCM10010222_44520 [Streptomyces tanashiensis]|uniref:hypothetical protein n=1 Tax=Streptomyces tanashiensis TaxID=67367 RepID=UPI0016723CE6|nr:hypothetical protein [Streptomyces tanashiensis]GGS97908.1 hypothetical protein GCM10010222_44520 [Streptomyces tanashiensis]
MPLTLILIALFALAFLMFNIVVSVRVWWLTELPTWRRILPTLLLCAGLAASASRVTGTIIVAETLAFPMNLATTLIGLFELNRHRARRTAEGDRPEASA